MGNAKCKQNSCQSYLARTHGKLSDKKEILQEQKENRLTKRRMGNLQEHARSNHRPRYFRYRSTHKASKTPSYRYGRNEYLFGTCVLCRLWAKDVSVPLHNDETKGIFQLFVVPQKEKSNLYFASDYRRSRRAFCFN